MSATIIVITSGCSTQAPNVIPSPSLSEKVAQPRPLTPEERWQQHVQQLQKIQRWEMEGRIAAIQGQHGGNASFVWKQMGDHYQIRFFGPFGAGSVHVTGSPKEVTLKEADGTLHHANSPEALIQKVAGWQVPLNGIRYWMLGIPIPSSKVQNQSLNQQGHLVKLQQLGWNVHFDRYHQNMNPIVPAKLDMENGPLKVKVIVKTLKELR